MANWRTTAWCHIHGKIEPIKVITKDAHRKGLWYGLLACGSGQYLVSSERNVEAIRDQPATV